MVALSYVSVKLGEVHPDPYVEKTAELAKANKRICELERALDHREDEIELLKKARRFFERRKR